MPETFAKDQPPLSNPSVKSVTAPPPQVAVKFFPVTFAEVMVTDALAGLKVQPLFDGVTVYVPAARPVIV